MIWVVVLCGVISGAAALGFGWWGHAEVLLATESLNPVVYGLVVLSIHVVALASIGGGLAVLVSPRIGRIAMLSSAVGWLVLTAFLGGGVRPGIGLVILLTGAGGLIAFLPGLQSPRFRLELDTEPELALRPRELARSSLRRPDEPAAPIVPPFEDHSQPFVAPIEDDYFAPTIGTERPAAADARRSADYNFRRPGAPQRDRRRPERRSNLRATAGVVALALLIAGASAVLILDIPLPQGNSIEPAKTGADAGREASSPSPSNAPASAAAPAPAVPKAMSAAEQARLPDGQLPRFDSSAKPGEGSVTGVAALPPIDDTTTDAGPSLTASAESQTASLPPVGTLAAAPAASSLSADGRYGTPFDYCAALANSDAPDAGKIDGGLKELTAEARASARMPSGEVRWRCMDGSVWVCVTPVGSLSCDKIPSAADRVLICAAHPDSPGVRTAGGDWSCDGFTPVVTPTQLNAGDHRGFDKSAWSKLAPPKQATG